MTKTGPLVFLSLLAGVVSGPLWLPLFEKRADIYRAIPARYGGFGFYADLIYEQERKDILFIGSSAIWTAVVPEVIERQSAARGSEISVATLAHNWRSEESIYYVLRDLQAECKLPSVVVISFPVGNNGEASHPAAAYLWSPWHHTEITSKMSFKSLVRTYIAAVASVPRRIVALVVPPSPSPLYGPGDTDLIRDKGALLEQKGYRATPDTTRGDYYPITDWPQAPGYTEADLLVSPRPEASVTPVYKVPYGPPVDYERSYIKATLSLVAEANVTVLYLDLLNLHDPRAGRFQRDFGGTKMPATFGMNTAMAFPGVSKADLQRLFYDDGHLNEEGAARYTEVLAQPLLDRLLPTINEETQNGC